MTLLLSLDLHLVPWHELSRDSYHKDRHNKDEDIDDKYQFEYLILSKPTSTLPLPKQKFLLGQIKTYHVVLQHQHTQMMLIID